MATDYQALFLADAAVVLSDLPAESAVYVPVSGARRDIAVVIDRQPTEVTSQPRGTQAPMVVYAKNSTTAGISGAELSSNDQIEVAKVPGGDAVTRRIQGLRDENPGWLELEVA